MPSYGLQLTCSTHCIISGSLYKMNSSSNNNKQQQTIMIIIITAVVVGVAVVVVSVIIWYIKINRNYMNTDIKYYLIISVNSANMLLQTLAFCLIIVTEIPFWLTAVDLFLLIN